MSDTPRTDKAAHDSRSILGGYEVVSATFARELERELAARPEERAPTEEMIDAGADAFLQAKEDWQKAQPKGYGAFCPLMITLPAAYRAMVKAAWHPSPQKTMSDDIAQQVEHGAPGDSQANR